MIISALLLGIVAGLRPLVPLAAIAWAANLGVLPLEGGWLGFFAARLTAPFLTALALAELVADQLAFAPSRKVPLHFALRLLSGGLGGAAIGFPAGAEWPALGLGLAGAFVGTLSGAAARKWLATGFGRDGPAALVEDMVALGGVVLMLVRL